jgi:hypothetical protein
MAVNRIRNAWSAAKMGCPILRLRLSAEGWETTTACIKIPDMQLLPEQN